jgi:hypothetical protein
LKIQFDEKENLLRIINFYILNEKTYKAKIKILALKFDLLLEKDSGDD